MSDHRDHIRFLLNDEQITLSDVKATETLLDCLRLRKQLRGTKEGCAEGDCGACTVLVGRLFDGQLIYETVNACIRFMGSLDACHVVTIEHLKRSDGTLHPVQQAMVDHHGSQCGFCTPGIVMSLYGLWMQNPSPNNEEIEIALQGNLCRCTGYEPIIKAAQSISAYGPAESDPLVTERSKVIETLSKLNDQRRVEIKFEDEHLIVPSSLSDLASVRLEYPNSTIVAGSTDVGLWVTKQMRDISPVIFISHLDELRKIAVKQDHIIVGACVSYTDMQEVLSKHIPQMSKFWNRVGGMQVRNMGTVGGNIANGSPIGDTPPALIALGAKIHLMKGDQTRVINLEDFFIDYGKQDREQGDFVYKIEIPIPKDDDLFAVYKISKRRDEDISALCAAFHLQVKDGKVLDAKIAFGGMAATPKRATQLENGLIGQPWNLETIEKSQDLLEQDFSPISDWRASSEYRMLAAKNLLKRFFLETSSDELVELSREEPLEPAQ